MAFSFWFQQADSLRRASGWMLNLASAGAAFLTAAEDAPPPGTRILLREMYSHDRLVREGNPLLPAGARVLRLDDGDGVTRRVAVRIEREVPALGWQDSCRHLAASCHDQRPVAIAPPISREGLHQPAITIQPAG